MEVLIFFGVIFVIRLLMALGDSDGGSAPYAQARREAPKFELRVNCDVIRLDNGSSLDVIRVESRGMFPNAMPGFGLISLLDGAGNTLQCLMPENQEQETLSYLHAVRDGDGVFAFLPHHGSSDWATLASIPKIFLLPKSSGRIRVQAKLRIFCPGSTSADDYRYPVIRNGDRVDGDYPSKTISSDHAFISFDSGYSEIEGERINAMAYSAVVAVLMSAADGSIESEELDALKVQLSRRATSFSDPTAFKEKTSSAVKSTLRALKSDASQDELLDIALSSIAECGNESLCVETLDLCLEVLAADGEVDEAEAKFLRDVGRRLGVENRIVSDMLTKRVAVDGLDFEKSGDSNDFSVLGVDESMSPAEIRRSLNAAFRKWNGLVHHEDEEIADKARAMLDTIGEARRALLGE